MRVAIVVEVELWRALFLITAALDESNLTVSEAICGVQDGNPIEVSRASPDLCSGSLSSQPYILLLCTLSSCLVLVELHRTKTTFPICILLVSLPFLISFVFCETFVVMGFSPCRLPYSLLSLTVNSIFPVVLLYYIVL